jgi:predicted DNA-binding protein
MKIEKKPKKHTISTHVSEEIIEMIDYLAASSGVSRSNVVEQILQHHLESMEEVS